MWNPCGACVGQVARAGSALGRIKIPRSERNMKSMRESAPRAWSQRARREVSSFLRDDGGATIIEYGLLISMIALVAVSGFKLVGFATSNVLHKAAWGINAH